MRALLRPALLCVLLAGSGLAAAQQPHHASPQDSQHWPDWQHLSPEQRQVLIDQLRERWDGDPDRRGRLMEHAQRWHDMTPDQRDQARRGVKRFERMTPAQREEARALFDHMRTLDPQQRQALRSQWKQMTPDQRRAWVRAHPPEHNDDPD